MLHALPIILEMHSAGSILKKYWGYSAFRGVQEAVIQSVLEGKDTLALLPTGAGKSVCFQVPAMLQDGVCLVISPLIALMKDQVEQLAERGITAVTINSSMNFFEVRQALQRAASGDYKFIYLSPERLQSRLFREYLPALQVSLIAVDEAHCISQWGYDFRPSYLRIATLREELPGVPVIALSASATAVVQTDIIKKLLFREYRCLRQSFKRANLSYSVFEVESKINKVLEILKNVPGSSIIYCKNRRLTQQVAELLQLQQLSADHYHAGLPQEERTRKQESWMRGQTRVMVCTNAFGMGIDKPNVRTVIHYDLPDSIENYYQEAGRAGRDGVKAYAVALYQKQDKEALANLADLRYPAITVIKQVYQSIADYLSIPIGSGEGNYYDFDLQQFCQNFRYEPQMVTNVLKALEWEGHLSFNENIFLPSQVMFMSPKELLEQFEQANPELETMAKTLLRTYEGIYDNRISISEKKISRLTRTGIDVVKQQLHRLQSYGVIEYLPQKETPQLYFHWNRAPARHLHIDLDAYLERKRQYAERVQALQNYLGHEGCRSEYISGYFGESAGENCACCDNCIRQRSTPLDSKDFRVIEEKIFAHIPVAGIEIAELLPLMEGYPKEKVWQVLEFLQTERKLRVSGTVLLRS